jgi:hypothetical protein
MSQFSYIKRMEERMEDDAQLMNIAMMVIALITLIATIIGIIISSMHKGG